MGWNRSAAFPLELSLYWQTIRLKNYIYIFPVIATTWSFPNQWELFFLLSFLFFFTNFLILAPAAQRNFYYLRVLFFICVLSFMPKKKKTIRRTDLPTLLLDMGNSATPPFSLEQSRYDQSTYWGRIRHFQDITDPRTLLTSDETLNSSISLLDQFKAGRWAVGVTNRYYLNIIYWLFLSPNWCVSDQLFHS